MQTTVSHGLILVPIVQPQNAVYNVSELQDVLEHGRFHILPPGDGRDMSYFIVGDDAFPLEKYLMKPFSQRHLTDE